VTHYTTGRFWNCYSELPQTIRKTADKCFVMLKNDPHHSSLHLKKVGKLWSIRIGTAYRALAVPDGNDYIWVWIGNHNEYERVIRQF
jgi:hypothetical protein